MVEAVAAVRPVDVALLLADGLVVVDVADGRE
jgi:hypothetical protein